MYLPSAWNLKNLQGLGTIRRCFFATQNMGNDSKFEEGRILGHIEEKRRFETYFHDQLGPNLMALAFSIECIRVQLEIDGHPAEPELRVVQNRFSEILAPIHQVIQDGDQDPSDSLKSGSEELA
jgi:hypothetical protein